MATKKISATPRIDFIEPMYAELVREIPEGAEWIYEVKFDGYRSLAANSAAGVALWSRRGNRFNTDFPEIAPIDYAFRPRLRIRLTLGGFTFPRKP